VIEHTLASFSSGALSTRCGRALGYANHLQPDFFGGVWSYCPDSVDFSDVEGINVYQDKNAFYKEIEWRREPTINSREINGQVRQTSEQRNHFELVNGTHGRSGEQIERRGDRRGPAGNVEGFPQG
jgi:hypothetical protein